MRRKGREALKNKNIILASMMYIYSTPNIFIKRNSLFIFIKYVQHYIMLYDFFLLFMLILRGGRINHVIAQLCCNMASSFHSCFILWAHLRNSMFVL